MLDAGSSGLHIYLHTGHLIARHIMEAFLFFFVFLRSCCSLMIGLRNVTFVPSLLPPGHNISCIIIPLCVLDRIYQEIPEIVCTTTLHNLGTTSSNTTLSASASYRYSDTFQPYSPLSPSNRRLRCRREKAANRTIARHSYVNDVEFTPCRCC
jgi:hypothetical protein